MPPCDSFYVPKTKIKLDLNWLVLPTTLLQPLIKLLKTNLCFVKTTYLDFFLLLCEKISIGLELILRV